MDATNKNWREENDNGEEEDKASPKHLFFPPEIITEIGIRLPTKSVGRLRCVSKTFCSLLSDQKFTKHHLHRTLENESGQRRLLLSSNNLFTVDVDSISDGGGTTTCVAELDYPLKEDLELLAKTKRGIVKFKLWGGTELTYDADSRPLKRKFVDIVGCSNGLVCICPDEGSVFIYNPTTGDSKKVPNVPESLRSRSVDEEEVVDLEIHGFGYNPLTDDYKVVTFIVSNNGDNNGYVYSLRADTWRRINDLRYAYINSTPGVLLNGAIHWVVEFEDPLGQNDKDSPRLVAGFDLETEEFRELLLPEKAKDVCDHMFMKLEIGILKGCLCLFYGCFDSHDVLWVMDEYGVERSWRKIQISPHCHIKPLCSTKNDGEVLLSLDRKLALYNFESNTLNNVEISGVELGDMFEAETYFESLISPNAYGVNGRRRPSIVIDLLRKITFLNIQDQIVKNNIS